jgi:hypothetical protein
MKVGIRDKPLLSFFGRDATPTDGGSPLRDSRGGAFATFLLEAVLSNCPRAIDAVMHAVSWGDPDIVKQELIRGKAGLNPDDLSPALQKASPPPTYRPRVLRTMCCTHHACPPSCTSPVRHSSLRRLIARRKPLSPYHPPPPLRHSSLQCVIARRRRSRA